MILAFLDKEYHGWAGLNRAGSGTGGGGNGGGGSGSIDPLAPWVIEDAILRAQVLNIVTSTNGEDPATYQLIGQDALDFDYADVVAFGTPISFENVTTLAGMEHSNLIEVDSLELTHITDGRGVDKIANVVGEFRLQGATNFNIDFESLESIGGSSGFYNITDVNATFPELETMNGGSTFATNNGLSIVIDSLSTSGDIGAFSNTATNITINDYPGGASFGFQAMMNTNNTQISLPNLQTADQISSSMENGSQINIQNNNLTVNTINIGGSQVGNALTTYNFGDNLTANNIYLYGGLDNYVFGKNSEVINTLYLDGATPASSTDFTGFTSIGSLSLNASNLGTSGEFTNLSTVTNNITGGGTSASSLAFPNLQSVGGDIRLTGLVTRAFTAPRLETVGGGIEIDSNMGDSTLTTVNLGSLEEVFNDLRISGEGITTLDVSSVETARNVTIITSNNSSIDLSSLISTQTMLIIAGGGTTNLSSLTSIMSLSANGMATLLTPALTEIIDSANIPTEVTVSFPSLTSYGMAPFNNVSNNGTGVWIFN